MTRPAAILLAFLLAGCGGCVSVPTHDDLRSAALRLTNAQGLCSGTAVGPDLLVTAIHCGDPVAIDDVPVQVVERRPGSKDFTVLRVTGVTFKRWATRGGMPKQGDRVRWWGTPLGEPDIYREGYVARVKDGVILVVAPVCPGDSGSGVFSDKGEVVAVVSAMTSKAGCTFGIAR